MTEHLDDFRDSSSENSAAYERLLKKIENQKRFLKGDIGDARRGLVRSIISTYYFLRVNLGMGHMPITIEELDAAEVELKKVAEVRAQEEAEAEAKKKSGLWGRWFGSTENCWRFYLENGFFPWQGYPFGYRVYCHTLNGVNQFRPERFFNHCLEPQHNEDDGGYIVCTPPNLEELFEELWKKRYASLYETSPE